MVKLLIYKWKIIYTHTHTHTYIYIYIYIYVHIYKHEHTFIVAMVFVNCWFINGILQTKTCIWSHMYGHNLKNERLICYLEQTIDWILSLKFEHYRFDRQQDVTGHSGGGWWRVPCANGFVMSSSKSVEFIRDTTMFSPHSKTLVHVMLDWTRWCCLAPCLSIKMVGQTRCPSFNHLQL